MEEAGSVLMDVFKKIDVPPPSQDEMRKAFRMALMTPEHMQAFTDAFGMDEYAKQMHLAIRRGD